MLSILFGFDQACIRDIDLYFDNVYDENWLTDRFVQEMIESVDDSKVASENCIISPVLGQIPPERLSGGVKALICLYKCEDSYIDLIVCGRNCEKWIVEIAKRRDVKAGLSGYDLTFENLDICARCLNDQSDICGSKEWINKMCNYVEEEYEG